MRWIWAEARLSLPMVFTLSTAWLALGATVSCTLLALLELRAAPAFALDRALLGSTFGFLAPLVGLFITTKLFPASAAESLSLLAQYGVSRRTLLYGRALALLFTHALLATGLAVLTLLVAGPTSSWQQELLSLFWVAPLAGASYGAFQLLGLSLARRGAVYAVLADWLFGGTTLAIAVPFPRSHVTNLLGGESVMDWSQSASAVALVVLTALCVLVASLRTEP